MYQERITVFIDILGFRNIVSETANNEKFAQEIFNVLDSIRSENIANEMFLEINKMNQSDEEMIELRANQSLISNRLLQDSSIQITHFSDSIVLSIGLENDMYAVSMIEYVCRLIYKLWKDFKILIRGGMSVGKLTHINNGALFGPAMIKAYDLESSLAKYPRIILDDFCYNIIRNSQSYEIMKHLFIPFSGEKENIKVTRGYEMNLATTFYHYLNSALTLHPIKRNEVITEIRNAKLNLQAKFTDETSQRIKEKYEYLIAQIDVYDYPKH
jgi:hypothetical protein